MMISESQDEDKEREKYQLWCHYVLFMSGGDRLILSSTLCWCATVSIVIITGDERATVMTEATSVSLHIVSSG